MDLETNLKVLRTFQTDDCVFNVVQNPKTLQEFPTLKYAKLNKLIDFICSSNNLVLQSDKNLMVVFFMTYPAFTNSLELVEMFHKRYKDANTNPSDSNNIEIKKKIIDAILYWMHKHPTDFILPDDNPFIPSLKSFIKEIDIDQREIIEKKFIECLRRKSVKYEVSEEQNSFLSVNALRNTPTCRTPDLHMGICEFLPTTVAQHLTYIDSKLFGSVNPRDCMGCFWGNKHKSNIPNEVNSVLPTVTQFNTIVNYIISSIILLQPSNANNGIFKSRATMIEYWIDVATELRLLKNFNSLKAIVSSLLSAPIYRLKCTWDNVSPSHMSQFKAYCELVSDENNNEIHRKVLTAEATSKSPLGYKKSERKSLSYVNITQTLSVGTVPYLGTFLTDLIMIDTAYPTYNEAGMINYEKRKKEFEILVQIILLKSSALSYVLNETPMITDILLKHKNYTEKELIELSKKLEPGTSSISGSIPSSSEKSKTRNKEKFLSLNLDFLRNMGYKKIGGSKSIINIFDESEPILSNTVFMILEDKSNHAKSIKYEISKELKTEEFIQKLVDKFNFKDDGVHFYIYQYVDHEYLKIPPESLIFYSIKQDFNVTLVVIGLRNNDENFNPSEHKKIKVLIKKFFPKCKCKI